MDARFSDSMSRPFILGENEIRKISILFQKKIGNVEVSADCIDHITRNFKDVKDIIKYENHPKRRINSIQISARGNNYDKQASITFSDGKYTNISAMITGRVDFVERLKQDIFEIDETTKPWYGVIHKLEFVFVLFTFLMLGIIYLTLAIRLNLFAFTEGIIENKQLTDVQATTATLLTVAIGVGLLFFGTILNRARDWLFPHAVFLIGQEKTKFERYEKVRWVIIVGFFVSLASGIVLSLF